MYHIENENKLTIDMDEDLYAMTETVIVCMYEIFDEVSFPVHASNIMDLNATKEWNILMYIDISEGGSFNPDAGP